MWYSNKERNIYKGGICLISTLDKETVKIFLKICRKEISRGNCHFINRTLNINGKLVTSKQALLEIGIMKKETIWNYVLELNETDCIKIDFDYDKRRDNNSEIYIFKKRINRKDVYIKLTMRKIGVICISFHESYKKECEKNERKNVLL